MLHPLARRHNLPCCPEGTLGGHSYIMQAVIVGAWKFAGALHNSAEMTYQNKISGEPGQKNVSNDDICWRPASGATRAN